MPYFKTLHPFVKLLFLISFSLVFFVNQVDQISYILVAFFMLLASTRFNPFRYKAMWICISALFALAAVTHKGVYDWDFFWYAFILISKWSVILITGYIYALWMSPSELIYLVRKGIRSKKASLPLIVGVKTLPHAIETYDRIRFAQTARGLAIKRRDLKKLVLFLVTFLSAFFAYFFQFLFDLYMILTIRLGHSDKVTIFRSFPFGLVEMVIVVYVITLPGVMYLLALNNIY